MSIGKIGDLLGGAVKGTLISAAAGAISALFMSGRSIGGVIPDVTFEEKHTDEVTITEHPVEQGAAITDHAYSNPAQVVMHVAWSGSKSVLGGALLSGGTMSINDVYQQMLDLQSARTPFSLVTGKRTYANMLIKTVSLTTDKDSENALPLVVTMKQVIITQTTTVALSPSTSQASPQDTAASQNTGTVTPKAAQNQSALSALLD